MLGDREVGLEPVRRWSPVGLLSAVSVYVCTCTVHGHTATHVLLLFSGFGYGLWLRV